jgi:hypothetical protein
MDWILEAETTNHGHTTLKNQDAIVIAHNFKGYDGQFILNYLFHTACIKSSVILNGNKMFGSLRDQIYRLVQLSSLCPGQNAQRFWLK